MKNVRMFEERSQRPSGPVSVAKKPITNDPVMLTTSVPHGNVWPQGKSLSEWFAINPPNQKRVTLPSAPPKATKRYVSINKLPPRHDEPCRSQELSALKTSQAVFPYREGKLHCRCF